jgi:CDP-glucose 4,6-dehydratase
VELWGKGASWILDAGPHPRESKFLKLDSTKAQERLGWKPRWTLDQSLQASVAWYKAHLRGQNVRNIALDQIESYQSLGVGAMQ